MSPATPSTPLTILLADDDPDDRLLVHDALAAARVVHTLRTVGDGQELIDYLQHRGRYSDPTTAPRPGLILLDLSMPKKDGLASLAEIKANPALKQIPIIVMTTSSQDEDIARSYDAGASSFVTKPLRFQALVDVMKTINSYWFETVVLP
ncbi:MAG TPA: response regulator [Vicinamibacterales bacterium]|nr:response regulator [Vicinamibacterales bacterium]